MLRRTIVEKNNTAINLDELLKTKTTGVYIQTSNVIPGTLDEAVINTLTDSAEVFTAASDYLEKKTFMILGLNGKETDTYKSLELEVFREWINKFRKPFSDYKIRIEEIQQSIREKQSIMQTDMKRYLKQIKDTGFKISIGDTIQDFSNKNRKNPLYNEITTEMRNELTETLEAFNEGMEIGDNFASEARELRYMIERADANTQRILEAFDIMEDLRTKKNITLQDREVDKLLIKFIEGTMTRTRIYKNLTPEEKPDYEAIIAKHRRDTNQEVTIGTHEKTVIDPEKLRFLEERGIKNIQAKEIINKDYEAAKTFIEGIEQIFKTRQINTAESRLIYNKNPALLQQTPHNQQTYITALANLYDLLDPKRVSGILPKHNPELYETAEQLEKYLEDKKEHITKVEITGLEKITNKEDKKLLEEKLTINPFESEFIHKNITRGSYTCMYDKYSREFGEGHYRKIKFGRKRRAVIKIENTGNGTYNITVVRYFGTHTAYSEFFKTNK